MIVFLKIISERKNSRVIEHPKLLNPLSTNNNKLGIGSIKEFEPGNFAKVLSGKYLENNSISTGYADWFPGERCPFYLPGEGDEELTGEAREQALYALAHPTNPRLEKAKRLLA